MSAADSLRRCKYKKNLANNVHVSRIFFKTTPFFLHFFALFVCYTLFFRCFCLQMYETNIKNRRNGATISSI